MISQQCIYNIAGPGATTFNRSLFLAECCPIEARDFAYRATETHAFHRLVTCLLSPQLSLFLNVFL